MKRRLLTSLLPLVLAGCALPANITAPLAALGSEFDATSNAPAVVLSPPAPVVGSSTAPSAVPTNLPGTAPPVSPPSQLPGPDPLQDLSLPTGFISKAKLVANDGSSFTVVSSQSPAGAETSTPIGTIGTLPGSGLTPQPVPTFNWSTMAPNAVAFALPAWLGSNAALGSETGDAVGTTGTAALDLQLLRLVQSALADFAATRGASGFALQFAAAHQLSTRAPIGYLVDASAEPTLQNHLRILALNSAGGKWTLDGYRYGGGQPVVQYLSVTIDSPTQGRVVYHDGLSGHDGAMNASLAFDLTQGVLTWDSLIDFSADAKTPALVSKHLVISRIAGSSDLDLSLVQGTHALGTNQASETDVVLLRVTQDGRAAAIAGRQVYGASSGEFDFFRDPSGRPLPFDYFATDALRRAGAALQPAAPADTAFDRASVPVAPAAIDTAGSPLLAFSASDDLTTIKAFGETASN